MRVSSQQMKDFFLDLIINYNEQIIISKLKQYRWDVENLLATANEMYEDD